MTIDRMTINQRLLWEPSFSVSDAHRKFLDAVNGEWEAIRSKRANIAQREAAIKALPAAELDSSHSKALRALRKEFIDSCHSELELKPKLAQWHSFYLADAISHATAATAELRRIEQEITDGLVALGFPKPTGIGHSAHRILNTNDRYRDAANKAQDANEWQRAAIARQAGIINLDTSKAELAIRQSIELAT